MNINILRYSLFGIAGGQEVDRNFSKIYDWFGVKIIVIYKKSTKFIKLYQNFN